MREENTAMEELQQEKTLPVEEMTEDQAQEIDAPIVPEAAEQPQTATEEKEPPQEAPAEEAPVEAESSEEAPAVEAPVEAESSEEEPAVEASTEDKEPQEAVPQETADEQKTAKQEDSSVPYHERYYLKYREGNRSAPLDLVGTKGFLQSLGFNGGELRQAREGKDFAEIYRNADKNKSNQMRCSYCGTEIAGVEFFRLPDGRMRCTTCSSTVVKTKAEVEELCQRVIANMDNFFGATIRVPVSIEVVEERKLKKKVGVPLGTKDSQSLLILGVAINKKKKYSIILENGAPRISLIATFAHELTHIWQYTNWDNKKNFKKCHKSKRLLIYEGMAKWAEIQYLYLIGETNVAKREEFITRNRQDEYGIGFCLYEDRFPLTREAMTCEETPFTPDCYPL